MNEENFIDSSEPWGEVTDYEDWFVAKAFEKTSWLHGDFNRTYLYLFTHNAFKFNYFDMPNMTPARLRKEFASPNMQSYRKSDISAFRIEERMVTVGNDGVSRKCIYMDYGNKEYHLFRHGHGYPNKSFLEKWQHHPDFVHARLIRGIQRHLLPFPDDKEDQKHPNSPSPDKPKKGTPIDI